MKIANPQSRVAIFKEIQHEQLALYDQRIKIIQELDISRPTHLTATFVNQQEDKLKSSTEESSIIFDRLVDKLAKDMENSNEDIDIAEFDLRDFVIKNDASLPEGQTFDSILDKRVRPTTNRRK